MSSWISFRGVRSDTLGIVVTKMPSRSRAAKRVDRYEIPGRSGVLHITDGAYDPIMLEATFNLFGQATIETVNAWLNGSGNLILSDDPTRCFHAATYDAVTYDRYTVTGKRYDEVKVKFECDPFAYEATPTVLTKTAAFSLTNPGTVEAFPLIQLTATGDIGLMIGNKIINIAGVPGTVIIDVPGGLIYSGGTNLTGNAEIDPDDWPLTIPAGSSPVQISWGGNVTQLIIQPNWGWL